MENLEIAFVDPQVMVIDPEVISIPAGTMAIVPHIPEDVRYEREVQQEEATAAGQEFEDPDPLPEGTILVAGQSLPREDYPEISPLYTEMGGFHHFTLPYLIKKFIIGINSETNEIMYGDAVIYYKTIPELEIEVRDIRDAR